MLAKRHLGTIGASQIDPYINKTNSIGNTLTIILPQNKIDFRLPTEGLIETPAKSTPLYVSLGETLSFHIHDFINLLHQKEDDHQKGGEP